MNTMNLIFQLFPQTFNWLIYTFLYTDKDQCSTILLRGNYYVYAFKTECWIDNYLLMI